MQATSRILIAGCALAALLAPAIQAELSSTHARPAGTPKARPAAFQANPGGHVAQTDSGFGAGFWIAPTDSVGFASAQLYDGSGRVRYAMRANLLPAAPSLPYEDQQGGFLGTLLGVDANGGKTVIAGVSGKWIRHASGMGEFGLDIVLDTGDPNQPTVDIGQIDGALLDQNTVPMVMEQPGLDTEPVDDGPATQGYLCLQWSIQRP
jgi:hypothetical protein